MVKKIFSLLKLIIFNVLLIILLIEITFHLVPTAMPDFPQWNYTAHYYDYKRVLNNIDNVGHQKPAIFFLGDSFVRGAEVLRGKEWVALLQKKHRDYEMVNMGFGGSSQVEEWVLFEYYVIHSGAKVYAICLRVAENDILSENLRHEQIYQESGKKPFLNRLRKQMDNPKKFGEFRHFLHIHSCTYRLIKYVMKGTTQYLRNPEEIPSGLLKVGNIYTHKTLPIRTQTRLSSEKEEQHMRSIAVTREYLEKFLTFSRENQIPLIFLYLPTKKVVYEDDVAKMQNAVIRGELKGLRFLEGVAAVLVVEEGNIDNKKVFKFLTQMHQFKIDLT